MSPGAFFEKPVLWCAECLGTVEEGEWQREDFYLLVRCASPNCTQHQQWYAWYPMIVEIEPDGDPESAN